MISTNKIKSCIILKQILKLFLNTKHYFFSNIIYTSYIYINTINYYTTKYFSIQVFNYYTTNYVNLLKSSSSPYLLVYSKFS